MRKHVLVLYYSQTGQLTDIVNSFLQPFYEQEVSVEVVRVKPLKDFPFPWTSASFFDAMPETVLGHPIPLQEFEFKRERYDLVVLAYQPWFLSLSLPINALVRLSKVQAVLKDTPVVTLIGSRNMWISSQEKLKALLHTAGAKLVGNIALVDRNPNLISVVTILYWMLTGKKDKYLGLFPKPGVSDEDIAQTRIFGQTTLEILFTEKWDGLQQQLVQQGAAAVQYNLMFIEERAPRLFSLWARFIVKRQNRKAWLVVFKYYLLFALFIVAPIVLTLNTLFLRIFFLKKAAAKMKYYQGL
ncbi:MAG: hypothetical protein IPH78_00070 [Bacteroidetes bacterium]|nr:hypothetical protein [Bacteroidota bacterium]MBK8659542.1 hypothetical protein [Bacteroidota bacterium]